VAPCYKQFLLAIRLKNDRDNITFLTDADIRECFRAIIFTTTVFLFLGILNPDLYEVQIAIVDPLTHKPKVQLAIEGKDRGGLVSSRENRNTVMRIIFTFFLDK
jgi:hypothetical protein